MASTAHAGTLTEEVLYDDWEPTDTQAEGERLLAGPQRRSEGQSPDTAASDEISSDDISNFDTYFGADPVGAINILRYFVDQVLASTTTVEATEILFPYLVKTRGEIRELVYEALLKFEEPQTILAVSLDEYGKHGNAERLALAASLIEAIGSPSFPVLRALARSDRPECDFFVHSIAYLRGVSANDRLSVLTALVRSPHVDVRRNVLEVLQGFSPQEALPLLRVLAKDEEEDIADEARGYLESFEA